MRGRQLGFVLLALILIGVSGIAVRLFATEPEGVGRLTGTDSLAAEILDKVVMRDSEYETVLTKIGGQWWVGPYPAVNARLETLWETAGLIENAELIATNSTNHDLMGVHPDNGSVLQFWRGEDLLEEFVVGDKVYAPVGEKPITPWSSLVQLCYLKLPGGDEVYAIFCPYPEPFGTDPDFWKDPIIAAVPPDEIETIRYTYADEEFEVKLVNSIWMVESDARLEPASLQTVNDLLLELRQIVTRDFPEEDELVDVDFSEPNAILGIGVGEGASSRSVLLLFVQKNRDELSFYVKDTENPWVYFLDEEASVAILKTKEDFQPVPTPTPTPFPTPRPGT